MASRSLTICKFLNILCVCGKIPRTIIQYRNKTTFDMFGRNVQMASFELVSSPEVFFVRASEKRSTHTHFETQERSAHFRVPDIALLNEAKMQWLL